MISTGNGYSIEPAGKANRLRVTKAGTIHEIVVPPLSRVRIENECCPSVANGRWPVMPLRSRRTAEAHWPVPGPVDPESIRLYRTNAVGERHLMQPGADYQLDRAFAGITPTPETQQPENTLALDYELRLQRVDVLATSNGDLRLFVGEEALVCPRWPKLPLGWQSIARIHRRFSNTLDESAIFPIQHETHAQTVNHAVKSDMAGRLPGSSGPETISPESYIPLWTDVINYNRYMYARPEALARLRKKFEESKNFRLIYFGDSITQGGDVDPDWRWTERFSRHLRQAAQAKTPSCVNAAIGGTNSTFGRERFERDVLAHRPDAVTVMFALNDKIMDDRTFTDNHRFFVDELRRRNAEPIFLTSNMNTAIWMPGLDHAETRIVAFCKKHDLVCLDAYGIWKSLPDYGIPYESLLGNGINHPDNVAAGVFFELLKRAFFKDNTRIAGDTHSGDHIA